MNVGLTAVATSRRNDSSTEHLIGFPATGRGTIVEDLPAPSALYVILGSLFRHLESEHPGLIAEVRESVVCESNRLTVFRSRPATERAALITAFAEAEAWLTHCEDVSCRIIGSPEVRLRKRKR